MNMLKMDLMTQVLWHRMSENQKILAESNYSFENAQTQMRRIFEYAKLL